jgi:hypothetical protein
VAKPKGKNFIELYEYAAGNWKTPKAFHRWAALSLIAACVEDRVWLPVLGDHAPLHPNIWVFLIGGAGVGKDHSIGLAQSYLKPEDPIVMIDGKVTIPALYDFLSDTQKLKEKDSAPVYLVSSDVTELLPLGTEAKDFTSRALALYGGRDRALRDLTRTSGSKTVHKPLMNWIAGCTPRWFPQAIDPLVFHSGYASRVFFVVGKPQLDHAHRMKPLEHLDSPEVRAHLRERVEAYQHVEGLFIIDAVAQVMFDVWLKEQVERMRRENLSDVEQEIIGRQQTSVLKLAMLFALADWTPGKLLRIQQHHMELAIPTMRDAVEGTKVIADFAFSNKDTETLNRVKGIIQQEGELNKTRLLRMALARGIKSSDELDKIVDTLKAAGHVTVERRHGGKPGRWPTWIKWKSGNEGLLHLLRGGKLDPEKVMEESEDGTTESENGQSEGGSGTAGGYSVEREEGADGGGACETSYRTGDET